MAKKPAPKKPDPKDKKAPNFLFAAKKGPAGKASASIFKMGKK